MCGGIQSTISGWLSAVRFISIKHTQGGGPSRVSLSQTILNKFSHKMHSHLILIAVVTLVCLARGDYSRDGGDLCSQNRRGCKLDNGECICGYGCITDYRYNSQTECYKAKRGRESDLCQRNPCKNGGSCSQTSHEPGFKCKCEGTGFYGQRCQFACPKLGVKLIGAFPYECILI